MKNHGWLLVAAVLASAWAGQAVAAAPAPAPTASAPIAAPAVAATSETEPPEDLRVLSLTDPQWRILNQIFQRHVFESPPKAAAHVPLSIAAEPTVPGGLYRLGPGGDLPVRLSITVRADGPPAKVGLRYYAEDFYGRKVADGALEPVLTDETGVARRTFSLKELAAFGCYHVLVTASTADRLAAGACDLAVVYPPAAEVDAKSPFGFTAPPGNLPDDLAEICRRLGAAHLAAEASLPPGAGLVLTHIVPPGTSAGFDQIEAGVPVLSRSEESFDRWRLGGPPALSPELHGEALAKAVQDYRLWLTSEVRSMRNFGVHTTVAATPESLADILSEGPALAGADGVSLVLDASAQAQNLRSGAYARSLAYASQAARQMGMTHVTVGQTGEDPAAWSPQQQAWKLVTRHVLSLAGGAERVYLSYGNGLPVPSAAAYAWMTHTLGGLEYKESIWQGVPLLEAHLFGGPDRSAAVVWSWIGDDPARPDHGALVFDNGTRLEAHDCVGSPVGIWKGERLIVPLGEAPVYITSAELRSGDLRDRIRAARILGLPSATLWVRSLAGNPAGDRMTARLWVQSHRPYGIDLVTGLVPPPGWSVRQTKQGLGLGAGQARELVFDLDRVEPGKEAPAEFPRPPYELGMAASLSEASIRRTQQVWPTQISERTIEVGYGLDDWAGISPVVVTGESPDVRAEVRVAWDSNYFYFAAEVHRPRDAFRPGRYASDGDAIQLAWGADDGAAPADPFAGAGPLAAITFADGKPQVMRLAAPRVFLRDHVPGNMDPWFAPVEGAKADISRDRSREVTIFEAAIPLKALESVRAERGRSIRFAFRIGDGGGQPLDWSRAAGVPDYLAGPGNFLPLSCDDALPCFSLWTFTGPVEGGPKVPESEKKAASK